MKNFCTDIQETARLRGLTRGGHCSSGSMIKVMQVVETISYTNYDEEYDRYSKEYDNYLKAYDKYSEDYDNYIKSLNEPKTYNQSADNNSITINLGDIIKHKEIEGDIHIHINL